MKVQTHICLAEYVRRGDANTAEVLKAPPPTMTLITAYYDFFANRLWADGHFQPQVPMMLGINAFTLWAGGVRMALSGHEAAIYPLLRTALESACYALLITRKPELAEIWSARHDGDAERKACRKMFASAVSEAAGLVDDMQDGMGDFVLQLYEAHIDLGAHPNTRSVMNHVHRTPTEKDVEGFGLGSIYSGKSLQMFRGLVAVTEGARGISMLLVACLPALSRDLADTIRNLDIQHDALFPLPDCA